MSPRILLRTFQRISGFRFASTKPAFTSDRYNVKRGAYASISNDHVAFFNELLGRNRVIVDAEECEGYNIDYANIVRGKSTLVLKPKTTDEVSTILKFCNENRLAVCPQSGNTGLVGGSVPVFDEIVISMKFMNKIIETNELAGVLTCEAGCVLEDLDNHLGTVGLMMPIDLGAKGSCLIGGCVSTNAGGLRLLRYGNLHGNVLGLEANSSSIVGLNSFEKVLKAFRLAKSELAEILSSFEMMDKRSIDISFTTFGMKSPLTSKTDGHDFYVLLETSGSNVNHDEEKLGSFVEKALADDIIEDGTLTSDPTKVKHIWALRERISEGVLKEGYVFKYDISIPLLSYYKVIEMIEERLRDPRVIRISGYGHLGDGNIHVQVSIPSYEPDIASQLEPFIFEYVSKLRGSINRIDMALITRDLFRNWWEDMDRYHRELEEHFKRLSTRDDFLSPIPSFNEFFRPWRNMMEQLEHQVGGSTTVERDQNKYQVVVDVQQFAPEEITVRTDDKCITIEGKHEEKKDEHGYVSRHFVRRYMLPQGYDIGHVKPSLSSDGILTITAPKLAMPAPGERIVPIERSRAPAIKAI
ncbi:hypothetical protein E2986_05180 [Frieseomelitta varia]|uniref:D-2-hydroxyglutarate dehydrogenase, mitochondrial n=2 Tax=Frieseomelitta varia TaxID=561572 RepID=A0A833W1I5_9HYME|nr:hypothetical protein E2986_05180 [Frieseomelitta varia]